MAKDIEQQVELGQRPAPTRQPADGELSDEQLDAVAGASDGTIMIKGSKILDNGTSDGTPSFRIWA